MLLLYCLFVLCFMFYYIVALFCDAIYVLVFTILQDYYTNYYNYLIHLINILIILIHVITISFVCFMFYVLLFCDTITLIIIII